MRSHIRCYKFLSFIYEYILLGYTIWIIFYFIWIPLHRIILQRPSPFCKGRPSIFKDTSKIAHIFLNLTQLDVFIDVLIDLILAVSGGHTSHIFFNHLPTAEPSLLYFLLKKKSISNFWNSYLSFPPKLWPLELWSLKLFCPLTVKLLELASQSAQCINSNRIFVNSFETCHHERNQNSRKQFTQTFF